MSQGPIRAEVVGVAIEASICGEDILGQASRCQNSKIKEIGMYQRMYRTRQAGPLQTTISASIGGVCGSAIRWKLAAEIAEGQGVNFIEKSPEAYRSYQILLDGVEEPKMIVFWSFLLYKSNLMVIKYEKMNYHYQYHPCSKSMK